MRSRSLPLLATGALSALVALSAVSSSAFAADEVVVGSGDTLSAIAAAHGTTVARLASLNHIADPNRIYVGQHLRLVPRGTTATPSTAPAAAAKPTVRVHVVRVGEHLTGIARHYHTTVAAIARLNRIANPSFIRVGQRLQIPGAVAAAARAAAMPASMAALVAGRAAIGRVIADEAARLGVPVPLAKAVAWQESGWRQGVTSRAGAIGVMQLMPGTAAWVGDAMLGASVDPRDLRQNVRAGVRLLRHYVDRYHGDRALVLAAYYQGQRALEKHGIYPISRPYIAAVRALERIFGGR